MTGRRGVGQLLASRATRILCCLMLWTLSGMAAHADDPKEAAREIGRAGQAAAGALARDAGAAVKVPAMRAPTGRSAISAHRSWRTRPGGALPMRTIPAARPGAR